MEKLNKITKIKFVVLGLYVLNLFLPIYKQRFLGSVARASVYQLNTGAFFVILFIMLITITIVVYFIDEKIHKITYLVSVSIMTIFLFILLFFKENTSILGIAFYFQIILIIELYVVFFSPKFAIKVFDFLVNLFVILGTWIAKISTRLYDYIIDAYKKYRKSSEGKKKINQQRIFR